jgi:hypothetical protein
MSLVPPLTIFVTLTMPHAPIAFSIEPLLMTKSRTKQSLVENLQEGLQAKTMCEFEDAEPQTDVKQ